MKLWKEIIGNKGKNIIISTDLKQSYKGEWKKNILKSKITQQYTHNCFVALSCDAPESKLKLKGHQITGQFDEKV